jgi:hypothetical protein
MELIKGGKTRRADTRNEQMYRVPAHEELWEIACSDEQECEKQGGRNKKADLPAFAQGFGGSAVA